MARQWADSDEPDYKDGTVPGWNKQTSPYVWDQCTLGGYQLPGVVHVKANPGRRIKREIKNGSNHEKITVVGYTAADVDIEILIWREDQYDTLTEIMRTLFPKNTAKDSNVHAIDARELDMYSIRQVRLITCSTLSAGALPKTMSIKALEYNPGQDAESVATRPELKPRQVAQRVNQVQKLGTSVEEEKKKKPSTKKSVTDNPNYTASPNQ